MPYSDQLERKRARLASLLRIDVPPLIPSPRESGFRQKAAFVFGTANGRLIMGHYAAASNRVVGVEECPVHSPRANRIADIVASVPELHMRTFCTIGTASQIIRASVTSSGLGMPKLVPCSAVFCTA